MKLHVAVALFFLHVPVVSAQLAIPRLNSIFPPGGQQGTTVECTLAGGDLGDATGLYFSHPGLTATPSGPSKFKVQIAKDVPLGPHDVRVISPLGLSNFRAFLVGDLPEATDKEPNSEPTQAQRVTLPVVVNGKMDGGADLDHFLFTAKKGQRLIANGYATRIDSQFDGTLLLTDAKGKELAYSGDYFGKDPFLDVLIPEDGDYILKVWDFVYSGGSDCFYRLHIGSLPHIDAIVPAAVKPGTKSTITIYGRNLPGGKPAPAGTEILNRPLEMIAREIDAPADPTLTLGLQTGEAIRPTQSSLDGMAYRIATPEGSSNPLFLAFSTQPIVLEQEPNNDKSMPQKLPVPCDVTGIFAPVADKDFYSFSAKKGEKIVVEVFGERQSGLIDPYMAGFDPAGKLLYSSEKGGGSKNIGQIRFTTNTRDVRWDLTAPVDGDYTIQVRDYYFQQRGSQRFTYRLVVRRPDPDFRLVVVPNHDTQPDATVVGRQARNWMDVLAFRQDGFNEPIKVEALNLPEGVTSEPIVIGPDRFSAPLVFQAGKQAAIDHRDIQVVGKANIEGKDVERVARGGGLTWGTTNTPGVARMANSIPLTIRSGAPFALTAVPASTKIVAGEKLPIQVKVERAPNWAESVQLAGLDLPQNVTMSPVTLQKGTNEAKVELVLPVNLKAGVYTFSVAGAGQAAKDYVREPDPKRTPLAKGRVVFPSNPITITVEAPIKK